MLQRPLPRLQRSRAPRHHPGETPQRWSPSRPATSDIRTFRVAAVSGLGTKRGRGRGCFIDSVLTAIDSFSAEVHQGPQGVVCGDRRNCAPPYRSPKTGSNRPSRQPQLDRLLLPGRTHRHRAGAVLDGDDLEAAENQADNTAAGPAIANGTDPEAPAPLAMQEHNEAARTGD